MIVISNQLYSELQRILRNIDSCIITDDCPFLYDGIKNHPDMQLFIMDRQAFIAPNTPKPLTDCLKAHTKEVIITESRLGSSYPSTALFNAVQTPKYLIANTNTVAAEIIDAANNVCKTIIHVPQGYVRCTTIALDDDHYITDDPGVSKVLSSKDFNVCLVTRGSIRLHGFKYGFIGGTCGLIDSSVFFNGDLRNHPDGAIIRQFCSDNGKEVIDIKGKPLIDAGSILHLNN